MKTLARIVMLAFVLLTAPLAVEAQPLTQVHRVGRLLGGSPLSGPSPSFEAFRQRLRELSYVEGQNLVFEDRYAEGSQERLRDLAAELVQFKDSILLDSLRGRIADLAAKRRLPVMYSWKMNVDAGGLMSYGPSLLDMQRHVAVYVDKILKGAKPADLPVEQPTKFELVINLKTAKALGLTIPPSVLFQADEVLQ